MGIKNYFSKMFGRAEQPSVTEQAGPGSLPTVPAGKAPNKQQTIASYKTTPERSVNAIPRTDRNTANIDITNYRTGLDSRRTVRDFSAVNPDLSATTANYLRVGIPEKYTVVARDMDGAVNVEGTKLANEILNRLTYLGDGTLGYNPVTDLQSLSESLGKELLHEGSCSAELVLDSQRVPAWIQAVSTSTLQFKEDANGVYPVQRIGSAERRLDIPTFFYLSVDQDLLTAYSSSYFEAAIQSVIADSQFMNDIRRSMVRAIQPRLTAEIIEEKVLQNLPASIRGDATKMSEFYTQLLSTLETQMNDLGPDDVLVHFDSVQYSFVEGSVNNNIGDTLKAVLSVLESKLAAGAKTLPAILGRDSGNATTATASSMLFLKNANLVRTKLNTLYSRILTQSVRLQGLDVIVTFTYAPLDLRPQGELEAYKSMEQSRILDQLSLGLITDEEACLILTGNLPPAGYKPLSGTMFRQGGQQTEIVENPASQTSSMNKGKPSTPTQPKTSK
jgi:hypothetical protein